MQISNRQQQKKEEEENPLLLRLYLICIACLAMSVCGLMKMKIIILCAYSNRSSSIQNYSINKYLYRVCIYVYVHACNILYRI